MGEKSIYIPKYSEIVHKDDENCEKCFKKILTKYAFYGILSWWKRTF